VLIPVCLLLTPLAKSFLWLSAVSVVLGVGAGVAIPAASAIAVDKGRIYGMGSLMGLDATGQALGMAAGSTLGGALYEAFSASLALRATAIVTLGGVVGFAVLTRGYISTPLAARSGRGGTPAETARTAAASPVAATTPGQGPAPNGGRDADGPG
jgi:MFS family permease